MPEQSGEKTHDATPHRRQQAREEGQVAKSQDLSSAVMLLAGLAALLMFGKGLAEHMAGLYRTQLGGEPWLRADLEFTVNLWADTMQGLAWFMLPILGVLLLTGVAVNLFQVGLLFLPNKLAPELERIDPIKGMKRLFSLTSLVKLAMGIFKMAIIAVVAWISLYSQRDAILALTGLSVPQIGIFLSDILIWTSIKVGVALLVLAILDYAYQKWKHEQDIKMTQEELREEMKKLQGDPQVIARRRAVQRQLVLNRLSAAVPKADVVVTNPTELAIAIQYEPATMNAPVVVAKGAGSVAQRIRRLALEHNIPIVEKKPLAQALYKEVELNHPIPQEMYAAVAEVLAYVYQLKGKTLEMPARPNQAA